MSQNVVISEDRLNPKCDIQTSATCGLRPLCSKAVKEGKAMVAYYAMISKDTVPHLTLLSSTLLSLGLLSHSFSSCCGNTATSGSMLKDCFSLPRSSKNPKVKPCWFFWVQVYLLNNHSLKQM